jgi:hypothetical protein
MFIETAETVGKQFKKLDLDTEQLKGVQTAET